MHSIEIDFDVFKALTMRRADESVTCNDVLRGILGLGAASRRQPTAVASTGGGWTGKGVFLPAGTLLRAQYKGKEYRAEAENGAIVFNGERFTSPSPAAIAITGNSVNGWKFWECRIPGQPQWQSLHAIWKAKQQ